VVTAEGFPLSYEVFEGNRAEVTTLEEILDSVERKHGSLGRVWVFDRGIASEANLELLRRRGAFYLVATPKRKLAAFEQELLKAEDWAQVTSRPEIEVKLIEREGELYVLTRSRERAERERTIRLRALHGLRNDLRKLSKTVRSGRLRQRDSDPLTAGPARRALAQCVALPEESRTERLGTGLAVGSQEIAQRLAAAGHLPVTDQPHPTSA
jgi:transposase